VVVGQGDICSCRPTPAKQHNTSQQRNSHKYIANRGVHVAFRYKHCSAISFSHAITVSNLHKHPVRHAIISLNAFAVSRSIPNACQYAIANTYNRAYGDLHIYGRKRAARASPHYQHQRNRLGGHIRQRL